MGERVMCDEGIRVTVSGAGDRLLFAVKGEESVRFWTSASELEQALRENFPMQLSVHGGFCRLEVQAERVHLDFGLTGAGRKSCDFPVQDLQDAIEMVRSGGQ